MTQAAQTRCIVLGEYIVENKATVRKTAQAFGISKSTVHIDVTKRLSQIAPSLASSVADVLKENKANRHIRGGQATKYKYLELKKVKDL